MVDRGVVDRIRRRSVRRLERIPALDAREVPVSPCVAGSQRIDVSARPSAWARNPRGPLASIRNPARTSTASSRRSPSSTDAVALEAHPRQRQLVDVAHAFALGFAHQPVIEIGAVPVRVGDGVVRARRDEQLPRVRGGVREAPIEIVAEEGEPALEAAGDVGIRRAPRPPLRERADPRQVQRSASSSSTRFASGVVDSPMAKRGCRPRSSSATEWPCRRRISAVSAPAKPEPTIATSASMRVHGRHRLSRRRSARGARGAGDRSGTRCSRFRRSRRARRASRHARTGRERREVPEVGEHARATVRGAAIAARPRLRAWRATAARTALRRQRLHRAVARRGSESARSR